MRKLFFILFYLLASYSFTAKSQLFTGIVNDELQGNWTERGANNQAGSILYATYNSDLNQIKCLSKGGNIWTSKLDSIHWVSINDHDRIEDPIFFGNYVAKGQEFLTYANSKGEFYHSEDSAQTWSLTSGLESIKSIGTISKVIQAGDSSFFLLANEWNAIANAERFSVFFSNDGGRSFSIIKDMHPNQYGALENMDLHSMSNGDDKAYLYFRDSIAEYNARTGQVIAKHACFPQIWGKVELTGGRIGDSLSLIAHVDKHFYHSNGNASQWVLTGTYDFTPETSNSYSFSNNELGGAYFGDIELYTTSDSGNTWNRFNRWESYRHHEEDSLHADINFVKRFEKSDQSEFHLIATSGGLYVSYDQLQSVQNLSLNQHYNAQYLSTFSDISTGNIYVGSIDQGLQRALDTNQSTLPFDRISEGHFGHLSSSDLGKTLWAVGPSEIGVLLDPTNDTAWSHSYQYVDSLNTFQVFPPLVVDPVNAQKAYLGGAHLRSDPDKKSLIFEFELKNGNIEFSSRNYNFNLDAGKGEFVSGLAISPFRDSTWYTITNKGNFYYSFDAGFNWTRSSFFSGPRPVDGYGTAIYASKSNPNNVYVAGGPSANKSVYFSWNKGRDWREMSNNLPALTVLGLDASNDDSLIFAATEEGPYVYSSKESQWFPMQVDTIPGQVYWSVEFIDQSNVARFTTFGRGLWDFKVDTIDTTVGIRDLHSSTDPIQLYPNPATNWLYFYSKGHTIENVQVLDLNGRIVMESIMDSHRINVEQIAPGNYLLLMHTSTGALLSKRWIKQGD